MNKEIKTEDDLRAGATGAEVRFKHYSGLVFTPGVQYLAEQLEAYWFLDVVGSYQRTPRVQGIDLQMWTLEVNLPKSKGIVTLQGDGDVQVLSQRIPYTDFPIPKARIWVQNGVMYLPCEH